MVTKGEPDSNRFWSGLRRPSDRRRKNDCRCRAGHYRKHRRPERVPPKSSSPFVVPAGRSVVSALSYRRQLNSSVNARESLAQDGGCAVADGVSNQGPGRRVLVSSVRCPGAEAELDRGNPAVSEHLGVAAPVALRRKTCSSTTCSAARERASTMGLPSDSYEPRVHETSVISMPSIPVKQFRIPPSMGIRA